MLRRCCSSVLGASGASCASPAAYSTVSSAADVAALVERYDTFLLDCDGVLWTAEDLLPRTVPALAALRDAGKQLVFVTNSSLRSRDEFARKFAHYGIEAAEAELVPSTFAVAQHVKTHHRHVKRAFVMGAAGLRAELEAVGVEAIGTESIPDAPFGSEPDFQRMAAHCAAEAAAGNGVDAVVCGFDFGWNFKSMTYASLCLQLNPACELLATSRDAFDEVRFSAADGGGERSAKLPAMTAVLALLESTTGRTAAVLGKPSAQLASYMHSVYGYDKARTCIVGDRLDSDILFGHNGGIDSVLVMTGTTSRDMLAALAPGSPMYPTHVMEQFGLLAGAAGVAIPDAAAAAAAAGK
jgi:phosphoglycolate/pyridoxal phosphate phosphatase family enzyme